MLGVIRPGYGLAEATLGVTGLLPGEPLRVDSRGGLAPRMIPLTGELELRRHHLDRQVCCV